jgi:DNA (cytosine-5)-methyltransferase 1
MLTKYKVVSLFSGAMGLDLGIESTGRFEVLACVEKERAFCETIRANQAAGILSKNLKVYEEDISNFSPERILNECGLAPGELDLLVGGPPCQSYSTAGKRGTIQDERGMLIWQFLRFVEVLQPKFFIMENVRGLISAALQHRSIEMRPERGGPPLSEHEQPGSVVRLLAGDLQKLTSSPYHMDCFEVNAVNYGAPQLRERAVFIGNRYNKRVTFPDPTHGHNQPQLKPWKTLRDAIGSLDDPGKVIMDFSPRKKSYLSLVPEGSNWRSLPVEIQKESMGRAWHAKGGRSGWWRRLSFDLPCPTLVTMPNHASTSLCHPVQSRALTLKEYTLIQEFPVGWAFKGTPVQQYAQAGNAVPVRLGKVTGDVVATALDEILDDRWKPTAERIEDFRIVYVQSHVRTRQWFKDGEVKIWAAGQSNKGIRYAAPVTQRSERIMAESR